MELGIVGGGPAGIMAALEAAKNGNKVTLFDNNLMLGRKLSVTGGGRGNLTNLEINPVLYFSQSKNITTQLKKLFSVYTADFLIKYLFDLGIPTYHTDDGWVYPVSNSAKNLSLFLIGLLQENKIVVIPETFIDDITIISHQINLFDSKKIKYPFDHVVIASGGSAHPQLGASAKILNSLEKIGYQLAPIFPALAPVKTTKNNTKFIKGSRFNARISLYCGDSLITAEYGNIIFTEWGLNGPGVMNLSHHYYFHKEKQTLVVNPLINHKIQLLSMIKNHPNRNLEFSVLLLSFIPEPLLNQYRKNNNKYLNQSIHQVEHVDINNLINAFDLREEVLGTRDYSFSQISTGGIQLDQIDLDTMKSKRHTRLSFAGEIVDLIGPCGGFNLHWAFISGLIAGKSI